MSYHLQWNGVQNSEAKIDCVGDNDEEGEDTFFMQNDLNLVKENVTKATRRLEAIEQELNDTECLLKIVNPKLSWDRGVGWLVLMIGISLMPQLQEVIMMLYSTADEY